MKTGVAFEGRSIRAKLERIGEQQAEAAREWARKRLAGMPMMWGRHVAAEHARRGGLDSQAANLWLVDVTAETGGRVPLAARDGDIRDLAKEAARAAEDLAWTEARAGGDLDGVLRLLARHCESWGIEPARQGGEPGLARMLCSRWYLRRLRRAHARRAEGAAIRGGVVRRGLWPYASQDAVQRRQEQRRRNAAAMDSAVAVSADGEAVHMAEVVAGSLANPENKRAELMVRIRGCDGYANLQGWACEFWTLTTPSRFHAQRITGACAEPNPNYRGASPRDAQAWLCKVWARARAAWKRRGLVVAGLRTAEPHHDGCPHWHLILYGTARDLRFARRLLRVYALRDNPDEPGARRHRFDYKRAETGTGAAAYAAAYVSKNIDGGGMEGERDGETGQKIASSVKRVDAWAAHWSIRQFQFFGMPKVSIWRTLRRIDAAGQDVRGDIYRAWVAADESDWSGFWQACERGGLELIKAGIGKLTEYGDAAACSIAGVCQGGRRLMLKARDWVIHWGRVKKSAGGVVFDLPRSCVNNCTPGRAHPAIERDFADMVAAIFDDGSGVFAA